MLESVPDDISNAKYYAKYIDYLIPVMIIFIPPVVVIIIVKQLSGENKG